jgi:hypothetical protein
MRGRQSSKTENGREKVVAADCPTEGDTASDSWFNHCC